MTLSNPELAKAREGVRKLLEELHLQAYLREVEPGNTRWQMGVDRSINQPWQSVILNIEFERITASGERGAGARSARG